MAPRWVKTREHGPYIVLRWPRGRRDPSIMVGIAWGDRTDAAKAGSENRQDHRSQYPHPPSKLDAPSLVTNTPSPSRTNEVARKARAPATIRGKREVQSKPRRVRMRTRRLTVRRTISR
jgi:hypothetical protein